MGRVHFKDLHNGWILKRIVRNSYLRKFSHSLPWKSFSFLLFLPIYFLREINTFPMHHSDHFLLSKTILDPNRIKLVLDWRRQLIGGYGALPVSQKFRWHFVPKYHECSGSWVLCLVLWDHLSDETLPSPRLATSRAQKQKSFSVGLCQRYVTISGWNSYINSNL